MRILFTNEAPLIKYGLAEGFRQLGHVTHFLHGEERLWGQPPAEQERRLAAALRTFRPQLVVSEGWAGFDLPLACWVIRQFGALHAYWAIEDPPLCRSLSLPVAQLVDYTFTPAVECLPLYHQQGLQAAPLLFACNPEWHRHLEEDELGPAYRHDLVLVAANYNDRHQAARQMLLPLLEGEYDLIVFGPWWDDPNRPFNLLPWPQHYGGILPYEDLPRVYSAAKVVLGLHLVTSSPSQTSMRTFEALGCGACYLTQYTPAHEALFENGHHLLWNRSAGEIPLLVNHYLTHPQERDAIARAGQQEVYAHHTYRHRALEMLAVMTAKEMD